MGTPQTIQFASIGMADSLILMVLALVVFGPRRLPQIGRQIGKLMYEFRKASNDFKFQMEEELRNAEEADRRKEEEERQRQLALSAPKQESVSADTPAVTQPIESPEPGESQSPPDQPLELTASEAARAEQAVLQVHPPSEGETVASARLSRAARLAETLNEPADNTPEVTPQAAGTALSDALAGSTRPKKNAPEPEAVRPNG
jgi:sec-independent protein translocase protein TatB